MGCYDPEPEQPRRRITYETIPAGTVDVRQYTYWGSATFTVGDLCVELEKMRERESRT
jgi:hypothetical protein